MTGGPATLEDRPHSHCYFVICANESYIFAVESRWAIPYVLGHFMGPGLPVLSLAVPLPSLEHEATSGGGRIN